ncbi:hypothetical protein EDD16DRAFT_1521275 [Pisolithus croceorrhizus]|nr:hypothetical protein EDD16DRAFT_1521275 [Pisolithus croceorrhizus]KAI6134265.1 hypothetical protein EV401DRAFT_1882804 [Pisolithus croceorrhizus]KAI6143559.1 hypothetical protein EDD17DRAFT_1515551 [Pisolithus thermaeus]
MFVKNAFALNDAVRRILLTYERLILKTKDLSSKERVQCWREATKTIRADLESVRHIADRTDTVPLTLIGVDKHVIWTDKVGTGESPFPDWKNALFPTTAHLAGHPWLLTVEQRFDSQHRKTTLCEVSHTDDLNPPSNTGKGKSKAKETSESMAVSIAENTHVEVLRDDGESEVAELDQLMDADEEQLGLSRGRSMKWNSSRSRPRRSSRYPLSQSRIREAVDRLDDGRGGASREKNARSPPVTKYGRARLAARTTPPPNPKSCATCVARKVVCEPNPAGGVCTQCKIRKVRCQHATPKTPAATTTSTLRAPSRSRGRTRQCSRSMSCDSDAMQAPRKKLRFTEPAGDSPYCSAHSTTSKHDEARKIQTPKPKCACPAPIPATIRIAPPINPISTARDAARTTRSSTARQRSKIGDTHIADVAEHGHSVTSPLPTSPSAPTTQDRSLLASETAHQSTIDERLDAILRQQDSFIERIINVERRVTRMERQSITRGRLLLASGTAHQPTVDALLGAITREQDDIMERVIDIERRATCMQRHSQANTVLDDRARMLEAELWTCRRLAGSLTRELEMLRLQIQPQDEVHSSPGSSNDTEGGTTAGCSYRR